MHHFIFELSHSNVLSSLSLELRPKRFAVDGSFVNVYVNSGSILYS